MVGKWEIDCLRAVLSDLRRRVMDAGCYNPPFTDEAYIRRRQQHGLPVDVEIHPTMHGQTIPFRCMAYGRYVLQVTALERILGDLSHDRREAGS